MKGLAMLALCAFVLLALGQSAAAEPRDDPDKRLIIFRENGIVTGLVLLRGSKLHFDRSGLGVNDSREAYASAYRLPQIPEESSRSSIAVYRITPGENLSFGLDGSYVMLSIYEN